MLMIQDNNKSDTLLLDNNFCQGGPRGGGFHESVKVVNTVTSVKGEHTDSESGDSNEKS